jgi:hypothetical protein
MTTATKEQNTGNDPFNKARGTLSPKVPNPTDAAVLDANTEGLNKVIHAPRQPASALNVSAANPVNGPINSNVSPTEPSNETLWPNG